MSGNRRLSSKYWRCSARTLPHTHGLYERDGGALKVQIDVRDVSSLQSAEFDLEVYRALFLEYAYRNLPSKAGKSFHQPPSWLIEGLYEDVMAREEGVAAGLYDRLDQGKTRPNLRRS